MFSYDSDDTRPKKLNSLEENYLKTRDDYISYFNQYSAALKKEAIEDNHKSMSAPHPLQDSLVKKEEQALDELEGLMETIIGPIKLDGFSGQKRISLDTLLPSWGQLGQLDGLLFDGQDETLFVTTKDLLTYYLNDHKELPQDMQSLAQKGELYSRIFNWDVAFTPFAELPVQKDNATTARAFLMLRSQDDWMTPNIIIVFIIKGDKFFTVSDVVKDDITIPECKTQWDMFMEKSQHSLYIYRQSNLKEKKAFNDSQQYEKDASDAAPKCFAERIKDQKDYDMLQKRAQSIIDRLQKD